MVKRVGRPVGQFQDRKEKLFKLICEMANQRTIGTEATTNWFAKKFGVGTRQIMRYLFSLEKEGRIERTTSDNRVDPISGKYWRKRFINPVYSQEICPPYPVCKEEVVLEKPKTSTFPSLNTGQMLELIRKTDEEVSQKKKQAEESVSTPSPQSLLKELDGLDLHEMILGNMGEATWP